MTTNIFSRIGSSVLKDLRMATPQWVRTMFFAEPSAQLLHFEDRPIEGTLRQPREILIAKGQEAAQRNVDVALPKDMLLERSIQIPPSNVSNHKAIAELDLLRRTPFRTNDVHWTLGVDSNAKSDTLRQWVAKKSDDAHFRAMLASHGFRVRRFVVGDVGRAAVLADFTADIAPNAKAWRKMNLALLVGALCAGLSLWLQPAWQAKTETARLITLRDELRSEALTLRKDIELLNQLDSERAAFVGSVLRRPKAVDALRQVTVALPDHVWLSDLLFTAEQITINGETSESAADLVLDLTDANLPYVPALTGPVSRTTQGRERFGVVFNVSGARQ